MGQKTSLDRFLSALLVTFVEQELLHIQGLCLYTCLFKSFFHTFPKPLFSFKIVMSGGGGRGVLMFLQLNILVNGLI